MAYILNNPTLRVIIAIVWSILVAGLTGAYPNLNPSQFNGPAALAAFILAAAAALAAHIYVGHTQSRLNIVEGSLVGKLQPPDLNKLPYTHN